MDNCSEMEQLRIANDLSMAVEGYNLDEPAFYQGFFCNGSLLDFLDAETLLVLENPSDLENERIRIDEKSTEKTNIGWHCKFWTWICRRKIPR